MEKKENGTGSSVGNGTPEKRPSSGGQIKNKEAPPPRKASNIGGNSTGNLAKTGSEVKSGTGSSAQNQNENATAIKTVSADTCSGQRPVAEPPKQSTTSTGLAN